MDSSVEGARAPPVSFLCVDCMVACNSMAAHVRHVQGKTHRTTLRRAARRLPNYLSEQISHCARRAVANLLTQCLRCGHRCGRRGLSCLGALVAVARPQYGWFRDLDALMFAAAQRLQLRVPRCPWLLQQTRRVPRQQDVAPRPDNGSEVSRPAAAHSEVVRTLVNLAGTPVGRIALDTRWDWPLVAVAVYECFPGMRAVPPSPEARASPDALPEPLTVVRQ